jgi:Icc-related predicted phosphoesterase
MARIAAVGDLHIRGEIPEDLIESLSGLHESADILVVTGDITNGGRLIEAEAAAELLALAGLPILAVMGNHDRRCLRRKAFHQILGKAGVEMLDGSARVLTFAGDRIGFAGVGGSGGGFWPDEGPDAVHNRAAQRLAVRARREAMRLERALDVLTPHDVDHTVVITHFAPTIATLGREPVVKYWLLGNCELGRVIDRYPVDLVLHGHAHLGNPIGHTTKGVLVRNVAQYVTGGVVIHTLDRTSIAQPPGAPETWGAFERSA